MAFFRKKEPKIEKKEETPKVLPKKSLQEIITSRVLTAEGWQRRSLSKSKKN